MDNDSRDGGTAAGAGAGVKAGPAVRGLALADTLSDSRDAALGEGEPSPVDPGFHPEASARMGRYALLEELGRGGMGVVWSAYDPLLDRGVALKLVRFDSGSSFSSGRLRARLVREAQAMARLSHPNVVIVHDTGVEGETAYVAMELVDGATLREWLAEPREADAVLDVFVRAGRGLEAAHAAGMVHRDFKPSNVLMGKDGRVRVSDFGLVRLDSEAGVVELPPVSFSGSETLTMAGTVLGTPAYMAPEQLDGKPADTRSDQFCFCVALYQALYGIHPFMGSEERTPALLAERMRRGGLAAPLPERRVPPRVRPVLERGLAVAPEARFPSMAALLDALAAARRPRGRRWIVAGAVTAAVVGVAGLVWLAPSRQAAASPCADAAASVDAAWNPARRATLAAAFAGTSAPYAADAWQRADRALDDHARRLRSARTEVCEATRVRHTQPAEAMAERDACLDRRVGELDAFLAALATPDEDLVKNVVTAAYALRPPEACTTAVVARDAPALPLELAARADVARVRALVAQAMSARLLARGKSALALAREAVKQAEAMAYAPLLAEALFEQGQSEILADEQIPATATLHRAVQAADAARDDELRFHAWLALERAEEKRARYEQGAQALGHARAALDRLPPSDEREADLLYSTADLDASRMDGRACVAKAERALALYEKVHGRDHDKVARTLGMLASCHVSMNQADLAIAYLERALVLRQRQLGPGHPTVATLLHNLGMAAKQFDRFAEAERYYLQALEIRRAAVGPEHSDVGASYNNLANLMISMERYPEALAYAEQAMVIWRKVYGEKSRAMGRTLSVCGHAEKGRKDFVKAEAYYRRALEIRLKYADSDPFSIMSSHGDLGETLLGQGRVKEGLAFLEQALARAEQQDVDVNRRGNVRFTVGKALVETGADVARGLALARLALADFAAPQDASERLEVETFLAAHAPAAAAER